MLSNSLRRVAVIGNLYLIAYAVFAAIFYKERIFLDGTYYFFHIVQSENFRVEHQRYILAVSQLLAVIGTKFHASLDTILLLNSLNPVIYLWVLFLLSIYWLKHEGIAWALLLSSVCGIYFIYFIPMYEVWYGCVLLIFFAGVLQKQFYRTIGEQIFFALLLVTLLFSYPLIFVGVIYFSLAHFLKVRNIPWALILIYALAFIVWVVWKYFFLSDYETGKIEYPLSEENSILSKNFSSANNLIQWCYFLLRIYTEEMIGLVIVFIFLFIKKERSQAILLLFTIMAFLLLIGFTQELPWRHSNYFERMYLLLIPLCFVPFFLTVFPSIRNKLLLEIIITIVIMARSYQIIEHSHDYKRHLSQLEELIDKAEKEKGSKFSVDFSTHPELSSLDEWSLPMEALIFSSLKNNQHAVTISWKADIENPEIKQKLDETKFRLRLDEIYPDEWLNSHYFSVRDGSYVELDLE